MTVLNKYSASGLQKCDLILGAEVIHEPPHAPGVHGAIRALLARDGVAIIFNGAPKHRCVRVCVCACDCEDTYLCVCACECDRVRLYVRALVRAYEFACLRARFFSVGQISMVCLI